MPTSHSEQLSPELIAYLRTGEIPDFTEFPDMDIALLQSVYWRRQAIVARNEKKDPDLATDYRQKSREAKQVNYSLVDP